VPSSYSSEILRQLLGGKLRRLRRETGLNVEQVAESLEWAPTRLSRTETGARPISIADLRALLRYYNIFDKNQVSKLEAIAKAARQQPESALETLESAVMTQRGLDPDVDVAISQLREALSRDDFFPVLREALSRDDSSPAMRVLRRERDVAPESQLLRSLSQDDFENAIEAQLLQANLIRPAISATQSDKHEIRFDSNESFWKKILDEEIRANALVLLENFFLYEWFPRSPGLFHTKRGHDARVEAERQRRWQTGARRSDRSKSDVLDEPPRYGSSSGQDRSAEWPYGPTYSLSEKIKMLEGGYGCIRLLPKPTENGPLWFMSASSNQSAHEGIPVALNEQSYGEYISYIAKHGTLPCSLVGKLKFLPKPLLSLYQDYVEVPSLYLLVEGVRPARRDVELPVPVVSVAVMFQSNTSPKCSAAYVSFVPGMPGSMGKRIRWLEEYVRSYGGTIVTDFDEQMRHFDDAVFSLSKVCNGRLRESEIIPIITDHHFIYEGTVDRLMVNQHILNNYRISIGSMNVTGDRINAGAGAVIINRSSFNNAVVAVGRMADPETVSALKQVAEFIDRSGNQDAITIFNEFNHQLQEPEPKKSVLRWLWNGIIDTLPDLATLADATAKIIALIH
jgi:transcriptional regulator with XRE-family HTH domain